MVFLGDKGRLLAELVRSMEAWSGCVSGALEKDEYEKILVEAGFEDVSVEVTHTYEEEFAEASGCCGSGCCGDTATTAAATAAAEVRWLAPSSGVGSRPSRGRCEHSRARGRGGEWRPQGRHRGRGGAARRPGARPLRPHKGEDALHDGRRPELLRLLDSGVPVEEGRRASASASSRSTSAWASRRSPTT